MVSVGTWRGNLVPIVVPPVSGICWSPKWLSHDQAAFMIVGESS